MIEIIKIIIKVKKHYHQKIEMCLNLLVGYLLHLLSMIRILYNNYVYHYSLQLHNHILRYCGRIATAVGDRRLVANSC